MSPVERRISVVVLLVAVGVAGWWAARYTRTDNALPPAATDSAASAAQRPFRGSGSKPEPRRVQSESAQAASALEFASSDPVAAEEAWRSFNLVRQCMELLVMETHLKERAAGGVDAPRTLAQAAAWMAEALTTVHPDCANVKPDLREIQQLLRRAAELGSTDARVAYASSPELVPMHMMAEPEAWRHWRDHARPYLEEAIARGNGEAAMLLGVASMRRDCNFLGGVDGQDGDDAICHRSFPLNAILLRDDVTAYAYLLLARELGVGANAVELEALIAALSARLTDAQRAEAVARANRMRHGAGD